MGYRTKLIAIVLFAVATAIGSLFSGTFREQGRSAAAEAAVTPNAQAAAADRALAGLTTRGASDTGSLEEAVRADPTDARSLVLLGYAYQQRWRETGDATVLPLSETALRRAARLDRRDPLAVTGLGSLALIRHDFRQALVFGRRAQRLAPSSARGFAIVGDALLELGRPEDAFRAFERMVTLKPGVASYARIAYARELLGDFDGATRAMQLAVDAAAGQPEPTAWTNVQLAKLALSRGRIDRAEQHLRTAMAFLPGYVYGTEQLALVAAARGELRTAIRLARQAATAVPLPQFVTLLAELYRRAGD